MNETQRRPAKHYAMIVVVGVAMLIGAGAWYWAGKPTRGEVRTAQFSCSVTNQTVGTLTDCDEVGPEGPTFGPAVLAGFGGLTVIVGAIVYAGRDREPRVVYVQTAPPGGSPPSEAPIPERRSMVERMNEWNERP